MKATTAYFVFAEENRQGVRDRILSERGEGAKASVCEVAKAIGLLWKDLGDDQREVFKQKALARSAQVAHADEAGGSGEGDCQQARDDEDKEPCPSDGLLPLSIVRRIALTDGEISRISNEGLVAIAKAADLLLGIMAAHASGQAKAQKRRTIMLKDFVQVRVFWGRGR
jgi:histone H3/H4